MADEENVDMDERNGSTTPTTTTWAYCAWHKNFSNTALLVQIIEQSSGPGAGLYACAGCRTIYRLTPLADQP